MKKLPSSIAASIRGRSWRTGSPGPDVQMADLGVAHLTGGQADRLLGRAEHRVRPPRDEVPPHRHPGSGDRIVLRPLPDAEAVDDDDHDRPRPAIAARHRCHHVLDRRRRSLVGGARSGAVSSAAVIRRGQPREPPQ